MSTQHDLSVYHTKQIFRANLQSLAVLRFLLQFGSDYVSQQMDVPMTLNDIEEHSLRSIALFGCNMHSHK